MPRISRFYGILIYMYYRDHPPPHFHALYGDHEALIDILTGELLQVDCLGKHASSWQSGLLLTATSCWGTGIAPVRVSPSTPSLRWTRIGCR